MWQKDTADVNLTADLTDEDFVSWCDALRYCNIVEFAGHDDWRLPNVRELQSIVDYGRPDPAIDPVFGALPRQYWSSTSVADNPGFVWIVVFSGGSVVDTGKGNRSSVRAVRNAP
jgi:hypothetical protein